MFIKPIYQKACMLTYHKTKILLLSIIATVIINNYAMDSNISCFSMKSFKRDQVGQHIHRGNVRAFTKEYIGQSKHKQQSHTPEITLGWCEESHNESEIKKAGTSLSRWNELEKTTKSIVRGAGYLSGVALLIAGIQRAMQLGHQDPLINNVWTASTITLGSLGSLFLFKKGCQEAAYASKHIKKGISTAAYYDDKQKRANQIRGVITRYSALSKKDEQLNSR